MIVALATLSAIGASAAGALDGLGGQAHDGLVKLRGEGRPAPSNVVLIDVDGRTVDRLDGSLPLPRDAYADAIRRLDRLGARAVVIDVQFTEPGPDADADLALLEAMEDTAIPVILATGETTGDGDTAVFGGKANLEPAGAVAAHASLRADPDRTIRSFGREVDGIPTIAQATARAVGQPGLREPVALLDPVVPGNRLARLPLIDLLEPVGSARAKLRSAVAGRVAVIGVTAIGPTGDDDLTIAGSARRVYGVEAQANAIDTVLRGAPLKGGGRLAAFLLALAAGALAAFGTGRALRLQVGSAVLGGVGVGTISVLAATLLNTIVDPVPALLALLIGGSGAAAVRAATERTRRAAARATLARFVPPGIVDAVLDEDGLLAPQAQTASVLFCDLRGYTSLVAGLERPESLITVLDAYLSAVTAIVHANGGTVVSFQGDGVMCAFGVPLATDRSARQALDAAHQLHTVALPRVIAELADVIPEARDLAIGVGVATGLVFAGTVGPAARREYAVVGPTTNLAARLQALTKTEGAGVVIDDATALAAQTITPEPARRTPAGLRRIGLREIRGLASPIQVWTLAQAAA